MDRFTVERRDSVLYVRDNMAGTRPEFKDMLVMACPIYFKVRARADTIANLMNAEWQEFEMNPT